MRRLGVFFGAISLMAGGCDKAKDSYTRCVYAEARGQLTAAQKACKEAVSLDKTSESGRRAAQKLVVIETKIDQPQAEARQRAEEQERIRQSTAGQTKDKQAAQPSNRIVPGSPGPASPERTDDSGELFARVAVAETLAEAVEAATNLMVDKPPMADIGALALGAWLVNNNASFATLRVGRNETSYPKVLKSSSKERGKRMCVQGKLLSIEDKGKRDSPYSLGLLRAGAGDAYAFYSVGGSGELVAGGTANICGVVSGKYYRPLSDGTQQPFVVLIGMFDLTDTRSTEVGEESEARDDEFDARASACGNIQVHPAHQGIFSVVGAAGASGHGCDFTFEAKRPIAEINFDLFEYDAAGVRVAGGPTQLKGLAAGEKQRIHEMHYGGVRFATKPR